MSNTWMSEIQTPALIIDVPRLRENIREYHTAIGAAGIAIRPHIKTHKMPHIAKMQIAAGAQGIACAKLSEAEVMADAGIDDILITFPIVGREKLRRLVDLQRRLKRLIVEVESLEAARAMSDFAIEQDASFEVVCEVDTAGVGRTGFDFDVAVEQIAEVATMPGLRVVGIYAYAYMARRDGGSTSPESAGLEEGRLAVEIAQQLRRHGVQIEIVAGGSSPTARHVATVPGITEVHPGTYVFYDVMSAFYGITEEQCAASVLATVVASSHRRATIDAGSKSLSTDLAPGTTPLFLDGYGRVVGHSDLRLDHLSEEHGIIVSKSGAAVDLAIGTKVQIVPNHVCPCVALYDEATFIDGDVVAVHAISARGKRT